MISTQEKSKIMQDEGKDKAEGGEKSCDRVTVARTWFMANQVEYACEVKNGYQALERIEEEATGCEDTEDMAVRWMREMQRLRVLPG